MLLNGARKDTDKLKSGFSGGIRMILLQDGVEVLCPIGYCKADDEKRNPNDIEQCPIGCETCAGDCFYYDEDLN